MTENFFVPDLPEQTIYHIGVSGGKDSTAVLLWMVYKSGIPREKLDVTFCDTDNEHQWTYDQIALLNERVHPITTLMPALGFYDLARKKKRFPSAKVRFCTEHLKIIPTSQHITGLYAACKKVVAVSGVRADESDERSTLEQWSYNSSLLALQWRPLIKWTLKNVLDIHREFDVPLNPLYAHGAKRVGCFPCIMSNKAEMRNITLNFPNRIDKIRAAEQAFTADFGRMSTFFGPRTVPKRFCSMTAWSPKKQKHVPIATIDDVSRWSLTGKRAKGSYKDDPPEPISCRSGFCE